MASWGRHDIVGGRDRRRGTRADRTVFKAANRAVFRAGRMVRSRRACFELSTGREYRGHGLAFGEPVAEPAPVRRRRRRRAT